MKRACFPPSAWCCMLMLLAGIVLGPQIGQAQTPNPASADKKLEIRGEPPYYNLKVGIASYSLRKFSLDETIRMTQELGIRYLSLKSYHLKLDASKKELEAAAKKIREAGLELVSCGVITTPKDLPDMRKAFEYARDAGIPMIIASFDPADLPAIDRLVKEFDIKIAIHNHGPGDKNFPSALDAYTKIQPFDSRIGVCLDLGHTARWEENEVEMIYKVKDRLLDVHIKDVDKRAAEGKPIEMGRGVLDLPSVVRALIEIGYDGHVNLEFEKDETNPMPGMKESFAYLRKIMAELAAR